MLSQKRVSTRWHWCKSIKGKTVHYRMPFVLEWTHMTYLIKTIKYFRNCWTKAFIFIISFYCDMHLMVSSEISIRGINLRIMHMMVLYTTPFLRMLLHLLVSIYFRHPRIWCLCGQNRRCRRQLLSFDLDKAIRGSTFPWFSWLFL